MLKDKFQSGTGQKVTRIEKWQMASGKLSYGVESISFFLRNFEKKK